MGIDAIDTTQSSSGFYSEQLRTKQLEKQYQNGGPAERVGEYGRFQSIPDYPLWIFPSQNQTWKRHHHHRSLRITSSVYIWPLVAMHLTSRLEPFSKSGLTVTGRHWDSSQGSSIRSSFFIKNTFSTPQGRWDTIWRLSCWCRFSWRFPGFILHHGYQSALSLWGLYSSLATKNQ